MDLRPQHRAALDEATRFVRRVTDDDLTRATACVDWTLRELLAHMVGQHLGFAAAVRNGTAPRAAYAPIPFTLEEWDASVAGLLDAFAHADLAAPAVELELAPVPLPIGRLVAAQFLDTVIHTWDVARSLDEPYLPSAEVAEVIAGIAEGIPDDDRRCASDAAFAPARPSGGTRWEQALARLGRDPHWQQQTVGGRP
jgi:uncharacterized protein (TIGR03086 family)